MRDPLAQKLILLVFAIAIVFLVVYGINANFKDAFDRALALIVVACPCALAFGSPLTMAMAYKKAHLKGITIRNPDVFEKYLRFRISFLIKPVHSLMDSWKLLTLGPKSCRLNSKFY